MSDNRKVSLNFRLGVFVVCRHHVHRLSWTRTEKIYPCAFEDGEEFKLNAAHDYVWAILYDTNIPLY